MIRGRQIVPIEPRNEIYTIRLNSIYPSRHDTRQMRFTCFHDRGYFHYRTNTPWIGHGASNGTGATKRTWNAVFLLIHRCKYKAQIGLIKHVTVITVISLTQLIQVTSKLQVITKSDQSMGFTPISYRITRNRAYVSHLMYTQIACCNQYLF